MPKSLLASRTAMLAAALALVTLVVGCQALQPSAQERTSTSAQVAAKLPGYLRPEQRPDSVALLPPPPSRGSQRAAADLASYEQMRVLEGSARWKLAYDDASLKFPEAANHYACALGFSVDPEATPHLYTLLHRVIIDAGQSTAAAKLKYIRKRPFQETGDPSCVPEDEQMLSTNGSYPSGHASLGFVWAEVLAEVVPDRAAELRERGYQFGQSRVVCRLHYQSDVDGGRAVGAAVMPALRANAAYRADVAAAKLEAQQARARGKGPGKDCEAEAAALRATASEPGVSP
ncbi:MAG: phosphatase PAP2 family protein [Gammaproteobacteria bacterium]|nr:phosphatase PAP2 family protein [Gammaproteobacteria bacterium]